MTIRTDTMKALLSGIAHEVRRGAVENVNGTYADDIADRLVEIASGLIAEPEAPHEGFAAVARHIRNGGVCDYKVGDTIVTDHDDYGTITWRVVGINHDKPTGGSYDTITVQMQEIPVWRWFDEPAKTNPWGRNAWSTSAMRGWLRDVFPQGLHEDDRKSIVTVNKETWTPNGISTTQEDIFLLSATEAGFPDDRVPVEGKPYAAFAGDDPAALRRLTDMDGDYAAWWLRTPHTGDARSVRYVHPDGSLNGDYALSTSGVAAACVIG